MSFKYHVDSAIVVIGGRDRCIPKSPKDTCYDKFKKSRVHREPLNLLGE